MQDYAYWYGEGSRLYRAGDWVGALLCYVQATRLNRHAVQAFCDLADVCRRLGRSDEARAAWTHALRWQPNTVVARVGLGKLACEQSEWEEAIVHFRHALAHSGGSSEIEIQLAVALLALEQRQEAYSRLASVLSHTPGHLAAWSAYDQALRAEGAHSAASSLYAQHAAALPSHPAVWAAGLQAAKAQDDAQSIAALSAQAARHTWQGDERETLRAILLAVHDSAYVDREDAKRLHEHFGALCAVAIAKSGPLYWPRRLHRANDARSRIAYLAVTPTEALLARVAAHHNRTRVAVLVFWLSEQALDAQTVGALEPTGARVYRVARVAAPQVARLIADHDVDVLIDCAGLAEPRATDILALQPARVRVALADSIASHPAPLVTHALVQENASESALRLGAHIVRVQEFDSVETGDAAAARAFECLAATHHSDAPPESTQLRTVWQQAVTAHRAGEANAAREAYEQLLAWQPESAPTHFMCASLLESAGDMAAAQTHFRRAIELAPDFADARLAWLRVCLAQGAAGAVIAECEAALARAVGVDRHAALQRLLGLALLQQDEPQRAASAFRASLDAEPGHALTHYNLGVALQQAGDARAALAAYRRAMILSPDATDAHFNSAVVHQQCDEFVPAIAHYQKVLERQPSHTAAYKNLGECLFAARRYSDWVANFRAFEKACPRALSLAVYGLQVAQYQGDFTGIARYLNGLLRQEFVPSDEANLVDCLEELLYQLLFFDVEQADMLSFFYTYDAAARHVYGAPLPGNAVRRPGRIRLGYLSADLRDHVMGKMMLPVIEHHDRDRYEIFCYSLNTREDDITQRFRCASDHYTVLAGIAETRAAAIIAADDLDLLVDLSGNTRGGKPGILARKPARVQLTHVASAAPVGLSTIDYKLTDTDCDLPGNQESMIETLLRMDTCCYPFRRVAPAPAHGYRRERLGIAAEQIVIGAFVTIMKLSRRCLALWRDVLTRIPNALIALSPQDAMLQPFYQRVFAEGGIARERLVFIPQAASEAENVARYELVDFVLDPMPYGGVNGTIEALGMGVPVVTLCGRRHSERTSYAILRALGIEETIAHSGSEYVALAVRLAHDKTFFVRVRERIAEQVQRAPYADSGFYTRSLERAYDTALQGQSRTFVSSP